MEAHDFYLTLQSDSNPDFFKNTITDFRNQLSPPIKLDGEYEVALVECTYVHSDVIVQKGEEICMYNLRKYKAQKDHTRIEDVVRELNIKGLDVVDGSIRDSSSPPPKTQEEIETEEWRWVEDEEPLANQVRKQTYRSFDQSIFSSISYNQPTVVAQNNTLQIKWEPKIAALIGYNDETDKYEHEVYSKTGITEMFIYCDVVHLQRVGGDMVPLLKKTAYVGEDRKPTTREFVHNQYRRVAKNEIDNIRMYIRTESGAPLPLRFGNFSATLHFKPV